MGFFDIFQISKIKQENEHLRQINENLQAQITALGVTEYSQTKAKIENLEKESKLAKSVSSQERKISKYKELYKSVDYAINNFFEGDIPYENCKISHKDFDDLELISPSVILKLHCMDVKSLKKLIEIMKNKLIIY